MKQITAALLAVILAVLLIAPPGSASAEQGADSIVSYRDIPGITESEIAAIEALITQRGAFSYAHLLESEAFMLTDGDFAGFTIELCKLLSGLFGAEFVPVYCGEWTEMKAAVDSLEVDFSGGFTRTEERLKTYYMTVPTAGRSLNMYMLEDNAAESTEELNGKRIGALIDSVLLDVIKEHYPSFDFVPVNFSSYDEGAAMLEAGEIDAIVASSAADPRFAVYDNIVYKEFFSLAYFPVSITTADPELAPFITVIDMYLEAGGIEKIFELYEEGAFQYKRHKLFQSFTEEESAYIEKMVSTGQKVDIGLQHDAYPASFYNDAEKEYQGVSIDILKEITQLTGLQFEPLSTSETTTLATILDKLKTDEISMMTQLLKTESRKNDYIWSEVPYLTTNYALLSRIDYPDVEIYQIPWERVGTVKASAHEVMFETWFPNHENQVIYDTTIEAFDALENGEIDLLMLSENMLLQQTNLRQRTGFKVNMKFDVSLDSYFGFSKSEEVLRSIVDKTMLLINIDGIAGQWMNKVFDYQSEISRVRSTYLTFFFALSLLALCVMVFLLLKNNRLSKSLQARTATLSTIYKSIPDTIFSKNTEGIYTSCNPSFEKQAGMPESEIIGKTHAEVFKDRVLGNFRKYQEIDSEIISSRTTCSIEEDVIFPDGTLRLFETRKAPLIQNGTVVGIIGMGRDVTERKEIKSRLDSIINTAQIAFILTIDGIVMESNTYCREYVGVKPGDDIRAIYTRPEQRDEVLSLVERYGTSSNNVLYIKIANGEEHRFLTSVTLTEYDHHKAHIVWALDIEQDEKRSDLLRETQLSFQTVLETLPMPIRIVDLETRKIVYVNGSLLDLLEYDSPDELCGLHISSIVPEVLGNGTVFLEHEKQLIEESSRPVALDMEYLTKSGMTIEAVVVSRHIDYMGRRSSIGIIKDLTEEKRMAQILRDSAEREKAANQAKSQFLANMSHEIRTPMNGIIGMTDLLLVENLTERQQHYAKDIRTSAETLLSIINDILDLSKISEGKLHIVPVDVDLNLLLKNTVSMMRFAAQSKGLGFIDDIQLSPSEYVKVDDVRLNQIIVNLLSNAVKFTYNGYAKLFVKIENGMIHIEVSDTGIGIREDELSLIFSAFEQADMRKNRRIKGTGLGLSITKNLVELMGGEIRVESEYEVGTTFFVNIPYVPGDESAVAVCDTKFEYIFAPTAQILLVDDIQTNLTVGTGLLRLCGITADVALSGIEAIELIKSKDYDIVFMDHMMPEMDGIEAMNEIKALGGKHRDIPIIALTANAVSESREFLLTSGMDDFLSKPIDKAELMNILKKWLPESRIMSASDSLWDGQSMPYSEAMIAVSQIEGLNVELALSRIGGLYDVLEKSISQVAASIDVKLKSMDSSLASGVMSSFALDAHGLKGALANIGAAKYSELAAELEIAAKAENMPLCTEKFTVFASALKDLAVKLKNCFPPDLPREKPEGDKALLAERVEGAINALESFEAAEALSLLSELESFSFDEMTDSALERAVKASGDFNYDAAIELLKSISI